MDWNIRTIKMITSFLAFAITVPSFIFFSVTETANASVLPGYVHYVWTQTEGSLEFEFHNLLSVLSVQKYLHPKMIMFQILADEMFLKGEYWDKVKQMPNIKIVLRTYTRPQVITTIVQKNTTTDRTIFDKTVTDLYHQTILCRLKALALYGGIYLDNDVLVQDSLKEIDHYDFAISKDMGRVTPSIIISKKNSSFVQKWLETFREYDVQLYNADETLMSLVSKYPDLVFVEKKRFSRRDLSRAGCRSSIFYGHCSHNDNFALKLYYAFYGQRLHLADINIMQTTFGEMARRLLYNSSAIKPRNYDINGSKDYVVPNIVHYVWYTSHEFKFHHYLSTLSALRYQKPDKIMFHTDAEPDGKWWYSFKLEAGDVLQIINRDQPREIFGTAVNVVEHKSDVTRMQVLLEHGGIYLDCDAMVVRSLDPIRKFNFSMGIANGWGMALNNGAMLSVPKSPFLKIYYDSYKNFNDKSFGGNSVLKPYRLACKHPDLIHIEPTSLTRPQWTDWFSLHRVWTNGALVDWSHSYVIHWLYRFHDAEHDPEQIKTMNTTFGEVARHIYYGKSDIILDDEH